LGNVLELGCVNGTYSKVLDRKAKTLLATDFSDEMVSASKARLKEFGNIKIEKANCFDLPYPDEKFDTVFMANLLHIIPEPEKAIAEVKRVLVPKGGLLL
jgi:ubiquinone/menaquinone biosynthesis C-methylase UbiE